MYDAICRQVYLPALDLYKGSPYPQVFREAVHNQRLPAGELQALQESKLAAILDHARRYSAFFGERISQSSRFEDLGLMDKQDLFDELDRVRTGRPLGKSIEASTSGSTGIALRFFFDSNQWAWSEACQWRGRQWWGVERGSRQMTLWARPLGKKTRQVVSGWKYRLRNSMQFDTFEDFDDQKIAEIIRSIEEFRPELIYGYGSSLGRVGTHLQTRGQVLKHAPRIVEYTADHMYAQEIEAVAATMNSPVLSAYGASETPGIAQQCWAGNMHVSTDNVVVEFLRPDGSMADPGETAEIVVTTLNNFEMPLIRYRVGDMGAYLDTTCRCGVRLPLMDLRLGKAVDIISTSSHQGVSAHVLDYANLFLIRENVRGIRQFHVRQSGLDEFHLRVVAEPGDTARALQVFQAQMREKLGSQIVISVEIVDEIPSTGSGKRRYFSRDSF